MTALRNAFAALVAAILLCGGSQASADEARAWPSAPEPSAILAAFLEAVDRGELMVFEQRLGRSMIVPRRIEYLFGLEDFSLTVRVYADLREPMAVPGRTDCRARAVAAVVDPSGRIVDTEVHVWQEPGVRTKAPARGVHCRAADLQFGQGVAG
jgi:hypothetical protein